MNEDTIVQHKGTWGQCERKFVKQLIKKERIQLLCVQETNKEVMDKCLCSSLWGDGELEWVAFPSWENLGDCYVFGTQNFLLHIDISWVWIHWIGRCVEK